MNGETDYSYQPDTPADGDSRRRHHARTRRTTRRSAHEQQPNSRLQFDNIVSYSKPGWAATTCSRAASSSRGSTTTSQYQVLNNYYLNYIERRADRRCRSSTRRPKPMNVDKVLGFFVPGRVVGRPQPDAEPRRALRPQHRHPAGAVDRRAGRSSRRAVIPESTPIKQNLFVWRTGVVLRSDGRRQDRAQGELQPLRPPGRHRSRDSTSTRCSRDVADLPVDRSEQRRHRAVERDRHGLQRLPEH